LLEKFYVSLVKICLNWRTASVILLLVLFVLTMRLIPPILGNELMPPMDTGTIKVKFETPAYFSPGRVEETLEAVERVIYKRDDIQRVSSVVGSEPGAISFGSGGATAQSAMLTVEIVNPTRRGETTWQIQENFRRQIRKIPGIKFLEVSAFGATPMATIRAPLDVEIRGPDLKILSGLADRVINKLQAVKGLADINRSWYFDSRDFRINVDPEVARLFGVSTGSAADQARVAVGGEVAGKMSLERFKDIPLQVEYMDKFLTNADQLEDIYITSRSGLVPLRTVADMKKVKNVPYISRENLQRTINITGVNRIRTIGHVTADAGEILEDLKLPAGYELDVGGTMTDMRKTQKRLVWALVIGLVLLYGLLVSMFNSFLEPIAIMAIIPLAIAGGMWGMLIMDKPMCMPAIMGIIFVGGTKVNDSIMLLDFIKRARHQGKTRYKAIIDSIRIRLRPILMTTFSTVVGLSPLALELAVGLERLSPLAIVAGFGMLIGTFLTMVVVPVIYTILDDAREFIN
ncbi:MAG: efflux RND transporter permease subunit, partial [bacterium]